MNYDPAVTEYTGPHGSAHRIPWDENRPDAAETVCGWLIHHPQGHPLWTHYYLGVVRLRSGVPGFPDPHLKFAGATHEVDVVSLNPAGRRRMTGEGTHECPKNGCTRQLPRHLLACKPHWYQVPKHLRDDVNATWRSGDFGAYLEARETAIEALNA